jgi:hypothetical protein
MTFNDELSTMNLTVKQDNLYIEESFTDLNLASIRRLTPVKPNGLKDKNRKAIFVGHTQLMTPQGPLPIQCKLEAKNLKEAMEAFPETMRKAVENMLEEAKKIQQNEESRIIVPGR